MEWVAGAGALRAGAADPAAWAGDEHGCSSGRWWTALRPADVVLVSAGRDARGGV
ncbi:hypothetical protein ACGFNX_33630 [Streptomyces sp. NPDC048723]|uniref:hypothetical protein n=1 Tax=Streptomyces sp. NPDC048723 TaxID=3365589 RepID=UPI00371C7B91